MQKLTFLELAHKVLEEEKIPLTSFEIWAIAENKGYDKFLDSQGATPRDTLSSQLYINVKKANSFFIKVGARPVRFFLKSLPQNFDIENIIKKEQIKEEKTKKFSYLEKNLHPILAYFGRYYLSAYLKTIDHTASNKKSFGEWLHPDMVYRFV